MARLFQDFSEIEKYVNTINSKLSCRVATVEDITRSGIQSIDGVSIGEDDRVLVKNQLTASENGIYDCKAGAWIRSLDFNNDGVIRSSSYTFILFL